jgi:adhesin/invasin
VQFKERVTAALSSVSTSTQVKTRLWFLAVLTCVIVVACERVPLTSPTGSTISVTVDQTTMPLNGQATVRAVVIESGGTPVHNGTQVVFTSSLGSFLPVEATTIGGVATSTFLSGSISGTTRINAFSGGTSTGSGNSSGGGVEVKIGVAAAAGTISVSATPPSVSQSGGVVTISATVFDASGNPLPGVNVQFVSSTGALSATTALSDNSGTARTTLNTTQTATVTAIAGAAKGEVRVEVSSAPSPTIDAPPTGVVGTPVPIVVTFPGNASARQIATLVVDFGDGTNETRSNITGSTAFNHTYLRAGGYTIVARATDVSGNTGVSSDAITISRVVPSATVSANPSFGTAPFTTTITTTAAPGTNGPPIETVRTFINGTLVNTSSSGGSFSYRITTAGNYNVETVVTDTSGNESRATTIIVAQ